MTTTPPVDPEARARRIADAIACYPDPDEAAAVIRALADHHGLPCALFTADDIDAALEMSENPPETPSEHAARAAAITANPQWGTPEDAMDERSLTATMVRAGCEHLDSLAAAHTPHPGAVL